MEKAVTVKPSHLYTKSEYSKAYNVSRPTINKLIENKELETIKVKGATLIVAK